MITIVDYRMGNVGSIANMIAKVGGKARISSTPEDLRQATKLVLPGVGHFDRGMANLEELGLATVLHEIAREGRVPVLGICLGMQLMCKASEEGTRPGLDWIDARVRRFNAANHPGMKVPHMGWNELRAVKDNPLLDPDASEPQRFYFVHSYFVDCRDAADVLTTTTHGETFCSAFLRDKLCGVQFHPEKSHVFGMNLFRRFLEF